MKCFSNPVPIAMMSNSILILDFYVFEYALSKLIRKENLLSVIGKCIGASKISRYAIFQLQSLTKVPVLVFEI